MERITDLQDVKLFLDSSVFVRFWLSESDEKRQFLFKVSRQHLKIIVTRLVLSELEKKLKVSIFELLEELYRNWLDIEIINNKNAYIVEAQKIMIHYPDNVHLAVAKMEHAVMVTYDNLLLKIAELEGVQAYRPDQLLHILTESDREVDYDV